MEHFIDHNFIQTQVTYCASQTINGCESEMIPVRSIFKYSCSTESKSNILHKSESTLNTIVISGTALQWYNSTGSLLPNSTLCKMVNGMLRKQKVVAKHK
jgi:hypothetical protein